MPNESNTAPLGDRELEVMSVLWRLGSGTVAEVRAALQDELAYTTVLTVLRNLEEKEFVRHQPEGRAHRYFPRVAEGAAQRSALERLLHSVFGGSPEQLITRLVETRALSADELQRLGQRLADDPPRRKR